MEGTEEFRLSFATTNVTQSIQAHAGRPTDHVEHYRTSEQKQRWAGTALLDVEPRPLRVRGIKHPRRCVPRSTARPES